MKHLFLSVLLALSISGCMADVGEDPHPYEADLPTVLKQAQGQPCFVTTHSAWETATATAGVKYFNVKAMNIGSASCAYKVSIDVYAGGTTSSTPVLGPYTLAPYSSSTGGPTKTTSQLKYAPAPCSYDIYFKYRPCPTCAEDWFVDLNGPFWC